MSWIGGLRTILISFPISRRIEKNARLVQESAGHPIRLFRSRGKADFEMARNAPRGDRGQNGYSAIEAAYRLGRLDERLHTRMLYDNRIQAGRRAMGERWQVPREEGREEGREARRHPAALPRAVANRGNQKQPSDTAIRHKIADEMTAEMLDLWLQQGEEGPKPHLSYRTVMEVTKATSKK